MGLCSFIDEILLTIGGKIFTAIEDFIESYEDAEEKIWDGEW